MHDPAPLLPGLLPATRSPFTLRIAAVRPGVLIFSGAVAIVAVHAAVDSFIAPEPGTTPGDHLLRGLVTLALLGLAVAVFPRLRAGGQAAVAAVLGALALEGAGLSIADARAVGARGEDWTGFFLAPAGVALLGLAAVLLWRSRKAGRLRWLRRVGIALLSLVGIYWLVLPVAVAILATHRPRAAVIPPDVGRSYEHVTIRTADGLDLAGWYVRSRNGAAVISYPTRQGKLPQARMLIRHGYGVLLLDARGYDGSQGDPNVFGWDDTKDIDAAVSWLRHRPDVHDGRIGGIGFSVGGEMMLQAAASNTGLQAVVSDGAGFRSVREEVLYGPRAWFTSLPEQAVQSAALAVMSGTPPPPSLESLVGQIAPRSVFFIYAGHGAGGEEFNGEYYRAASAPKRIWRIAEAKHTGGFAARPRAYERRVVGFFDEALPPARPQDSVVAPARTPVGRLEGGS
ncbi:MAG: alpha/beta hydrolase [Verrucomicrobiota bacterium]